MLKPLLRCLKESRANKPVTVIAVKNAALPILECDNTRPITIKAKVIRTTAFPCMSVATILRARLLLVVAL